MHLGVIHEIRDPAGWDRVMGSKELYGHPDLPPGFAILASITQDDAARGVCFWEAPSAAELQSLLADVRPRPDPVGGCSRPNAPASSTAS